MAGSLFQREDESDLDNAPASAVLNAANDKDSFIPARRDGGLLQSCSGRASLFAFVTFAYVYQDLMTRVTPLKCVQLKIKGHSPKLTSSSCVSSAEKRAQDLSKMQTLERNWRRSDECRCKCVT